MLERRPRFEWDLKQYSARTVPAILQPSPGGLRRARGVEVYRKTDLDINVSIPEIFLT